MKIYSLIIRYLCLVIAVFLLPTSSLAQSEPCNVQVTATCTGSTNCSGFLAGSTYIINTGTSSIMCQMVNDFGAEETVLLSPGQATTVYAFMIIGGGCGDFYGKNESGWTKAYCQVNDNPDATCENFSAWECSATCEVPVPIDIKPISCPNTVSLRGKGALTVAIMGGADLDITKINPAYIRLSREGNTGVVAPLSWSNQDVGSSFEGELCYCNKSKRDGYSDLVLTFDIQQVVNTLGIDMVTEQPLPLKITGLLTEECEGRPFDKPIKGQDCVLIKK